MTDNQEFKPRLCKLKKWSTFNGYGFNLHAEKNKNGQYIGKIDADSPAEKVGLKEHDRIIEVNGVNILTENHQQVVNRIKAIPDETCLLVIDRQTDAFYKKNNLTVTGEDDVVEVHICPNVASEPAEIYVQSDKKAKANEVTTEVEFNHEQNDVNFKINDEVKDEIITEPVIHSDNQINNVKDEENIDEIKEWNNNENTEVTLRKDDVNQVVEAAVVAATNIVENENITTNEVVVVNNVDTLTKSEEDQVADDLENLAQAEQEKSSRASTVSSVGDSSPKEYDLSNAIDNDIDEAAVHATSIKSEHNKDFVSSKTVEQQQPNGTIQDAPKRESIVIGGIEFAGSAKEARERMKKKSKNDPRVNSGTAIGLSPKEKLDLLNRL